MKYLLAQRISPIVIERDMKKFFHTLPSVAPYEVVPVKALSDNYMYLVIDKVTKETAAIDCVAPNDIIAEATRRNCKISHVLTTHSHWDHDGGNPEMKRKLQVPILGGVNDNAKAVTREVGEDDVIKIGNTKIKVIETPFHTPGHICFYIEGADDYPGSVFTGDTLFVGGCGNLNRGSKEQLHRAFHKLGNLPKETFVWVGHEYTKANLSYALTLSQPPFLVEKYKWTLETSITVPSTIGEEHTTSPFMQAAFGNNSNIEASCGSKDPIEQIYFVRQDKSSGKWKTKWDKLKSTL